ncbi:MAG: NADH-quinone oxidoreductase subunit M [Gammaproteobacteria bacterium]|nr:NADH-quinone oxidoreductase subunit M [Gammaproteobacteria bacterium]MBU1601013.1 NADH-quinone oxidoreductase subunit M [Gammaproteobacteria bacterium]MBU2434372.1 NADH-quinone oxidoreductase subunit M [Gammaproteobacteria bacterium]MBU2450776.1 NADH-quinone oxidoreductase subunit M [Gammaproteobacteria bacterium]
MSLPLLSLLLFLPLLGIASIWLLPVRATRHVVAFTMLVTLALATAALVAYDPAGARFQLLERVTWIASLNIHYLVAVDGISVLFLPATALLFLGSLVASWNAVPDAPRLHYSLLLLFEMATLGIFCALDTALFFVFWELTLVPLYFLLGRWGVTGGSAHAATRYFLIMLAGGIPLLIAFVILATSQPVLTFDLTVLLGAPLPRATQTAVFLLCLLGFGVKVPLVPLHTWLPQFALAAPGSLTALIVGLKLGAFGLIRFAIPLAPQAALDLHWLLAGLGTVAILYGAVGMLAQSNLRLGLAYASICHVGLAVLGLASYTAQAAQGAVSLLLSFSVATGGAFVLLEFLRQRTGSTDVNALGGAAKTMPLLATGFMICGLAGVGMPGTSSFPGEFMLIISALEHHTGAGMAALFGLAIAAGGFLSLYRKAFFGPVSRAAVANASDLRPREWAVLVALIVMIVGIGINPGPWIEIVRPAAEAWAAGLGR